MAEVVVIDRKQQQATIEAEDDTPLMFSLRESGLPVEGTCGGTAACGTCHVFVEDAWRSSLPAPEPMELEMLMALEHYDPNRSRLSCQLVVQKAWAGLIVSLAPEELV